MTRTKRGKFKRGERNLAIKHFLICFPQFGTLRGSLSSIEKRRGRKEIKSTRRRRQGVKRRETNLASSSLSVLHSLGHPKIFTELGTEEEWE